MRCLVASLTECALLFSALETVETEQPAALANSCRVTGINVYPLSQKVKSLFQNIHMTLTVILFHKLDRLRTDPLWKGGQDKNQHPIHPSHRRSPISV
jgi:hypothetical protein